MIDLQALLDDVIATYGENKGYLKPTIQWSEENRLWLVGEYQYWLNRILISRLLNTDEVSKETLQAIIYHEYLHQIYVEHPDAFEKRMARIPNYKAHMMKAESYLDSLDTFPPAHKRSAFDVRNRKVVFCLFPTLENDGYGRAFTYMNHFLCLDFGKKRPFGQDITDAHPNLVVWLYRQDDALYIVGWAKDVKFFTSPVKVQHKPFGGFDFKYQALVRQCDCRMLLPYVEACILLPEDFFPAQYGYIGACLDFEIADYMPEDVYRIIEEYDREYHDLYISDDAIEAFAPLTTNSAQEIIDLYNKCEHGMRSLWIANLAVRRKPCYDTHMIRADALSALCLLELAEQEYQKALDAKPEASEALQRLARTRACLSTPGCPRT